MSKRRVVVTGIGMVSPLGVGNEPTWQGLIEGRSGVGPITKFDATAFACRIAGEVKGFVPEQWMEKKEVKKSDTFIHYAMAAADMAVQDAGLDCANCNGERFGVIVGSGIGGLPLIEEMHSKLLERGPSRISPFFIPGLIINLAAGQISIRYGCQGPSSAPATACATGAHAIGDAFKVIQRDDADIMFAGGSEAVVCSLAVGGFAAMRALTTRNDDPEHASRPWDLNRDGFVIGEGAGMLILEELEHAKARGASIYCEIAGYGMSSDAYHITSPAEDGGGMVRVMKAALRDAQLNPSAIDYINAHGTSTSVGDLTETVAIKGVFGDDAYKVAVSSTKSMTGHLLGAAGGLEAAIAAMTIKTNVIPPTINYETPDPACDLDYVPNTAREMKVTNVMSNSFGFGGTNATLIFSRLS
ncbi:MAG: 3-oxoacyl-[acyl-carrier-protein] synthase [Thermoanaerobaculia bacterium]|jgi:3-oxoacyl-[acyl-carrier-protein] synthase II|nr:3-oxoacyl-[acyl-carrier-protein] synthase [Thermoanaerobaculia bacterium]